MLNKMLLDIPTCFETERLIVRCYEAGDGPVLYAAGVRNREHLQRYEAGNVILTCKTEEEAEILAGELHADWVARNCFFMGAFDKATREFVAQIYVGAVNWDLPEFEIGYFADKDHEGRGFVTEAVRGALRFVFERLRAHRVRLGANETNTRSRRVAERCGFVQEGHLRESRRNPDGTFSGDVLYGLLESDYSIAARAVVLTMVRSVEEREGARLLVDSLRAFGGAWGECPVWLFEADPDRAPCAALASERVRVLPLHVPDLLRRYDFGDKVYACAQAEAMAQGVQSIVWADPGVLALQPPRLYDLGTSFDVAVRPVHIKNVGLLATEPLDGFWQKVYQAAGVQDISATVESFVDGQHLRAYFNSHAFAIRPSTGLLRQWLECFESLVGDQAFQSACCQDERHQVFLHQVVLSALIATRLDPQRVRILPPAYNYPYNLHQSVPRERRAVALNDLVCVAYEGRSLDPDAMDDIAVREPLRSWLLAWQ